LGLSLVCNLIDCVIRITCNIICCYLLLFLYLPVFTRRLNCIDNPPFIIELTGQYTMIRGRDYQALV